MKVIVTGGAGFIGSHLVDKLIDQGCEVNVIDNFSTGRKENLNPKATLWRAGQEGQNLINYFRYGGDMIEGDVDVVFHLAAMPRIQPSFKAPWHTYEMNSTGTIVAIHMAQHHNARLVYAGSSSAYHDVLANPYAYSKWLGENHCKLYAKLYHLPVAIARFFNVYGPRQIEKGSYATVIGIFERLRREDKPLTITGNGKQQRDFTHVSDIVDGLIAMSHEDWHAATFNLGTGTAFSINEVAEMFGGPVKYIRKRKGEALNTQADTSFTGKMLGWKSKIKLPDYIGQLPSSS